MAAEDLHVGAELLSANGEIDRVKGLALDAEMATTYNFEVERTHNDFAGGLLVHNMKKQEP